MIELHTSDMASVTLVPNAFIDEHMFEANGEFVKLYLYLLRTVSLPGRRFTISSLADEISFTENDIMRALKYWERFNYLSLNYDESGKLCGISLMPLGNSTTPAVGISTATAAAAPAAPAVPSAPQREAAPVRQAPVYVVKERSIEELENFKNDPEAGELLFVTERYMKHPLSQKDIETIIFWHDELKLPYDLIEYLIESCLEKEHFSFKYMNAIAINWAEHDIFTIEAAKQSASIHSQAHYSVMKLMGITGRSLVPDEESFIDKWTGEYGFTMDVIGEACRRTVANTGKSSFNYADRILSDWFAAGVHHSEDIAALDARRTAKYAAAAAGRAQSPKANFTGRDYDYAMLEAQLLDANEN